MDVFRLKWRGAWFKPGIQSIDEVQLAHNLDGFVPGHDVLAHTIDKVRLGFIVGSMAAAKNDYRGIANPFGRLIEDHFIDGSSYTAG